MKGSDKLRQIPVTLTLLGVNTIAFILITLKGADFWKGNGLLLLHYGANYWPFTILRNEYWRLISSMFLHAGIMHLTTNMIGLIVGGYFLEPVLKRWKFVTLYLLTGIIANFISIYYHRTTIGVGASGAIFGIYGVFIALLTTNLFPSTIRKTFLAYIGLFILLNAITALIAEDMDNIAHLGGFLSGIILGYICYFILSKEDGKKIIE
ncbi:rhomboid family intramembrane serine protease [Chitinophaga silvatica]|uniref:Rhomboid family intramembrane serine protease n=1 Tax=Chitinophaga silvatica TaxID=2282649 RepID=A0A3E1YE23_9BACT|nr:rhomboid family intramembrane serine protease [Chitinophaga silvatica]RFS24527.1 rhomboid family intramembrane serine protease [Chitinophaga silvatica]